jgi:hypothetical protein
MDQLYVVLTASNSDQFLGVSVRFTVINNCVYKHSVALNSFHMLIWAFYSTYARNFKIQNSIFKF